MTVRSLQRAADLATFAGMNVRSHLPFALALIFAALALAGDPASAAVQSCRAVMSKKTGVIQVYAKDITQRIAQGKLEWAPDLESPFQPFANEDTCWKGGKARACQLGAEGTSESVTPPDGCELWLSDGVDLCQTRILGCVPGVRSVDELSDEVVALRAEVDLLRSQLDAILSVVRVDDGDLVLDTRTGGGDVRIEGRNVTVDASSSAKVIGAGQAVLSSSALTEVDGAIVTLANGARQVARQGDAVAVECPGGACSGAIVGGSAVVLVP